MYLAHRDNVPWSSPGEDKQAESVCGPAQVL